MVLTLFHHAQTLEQVRVRIAQAVRTGTHLEHPLGVLLPVGLVADACLYGVVHGVGSAYGFRVTITLSDTGGTQSIFGDRFLNPLTLR